MASCVKNIPTENCQNLITGFKLQLKMSGMLFGTQCIYGIDIDQTVLSNIFARQC